MSLTIRRATISDVQIISALGITTCYEAYFELDPSKDLAEYCVKFFSLEALTAEFEDTSSTFLIAELNCKAIGYAKLREGKKIECLQGKNAIEVQRIYILEKMKGKKLGAKLMEKCFEIAREKNYETLWLGVWDKNIAAQKFYEKIGMKIIGITDFSDGKNEFINLVFATEIL
ncbi:MAG TPA: GNAT family N-acetyltransferase [Pyrinomonadaceae bacterium]|mgnify:CR=1 FL=1|nr:GNAT family N-acetyltransferase [Pyrinomonadaceae bacterium]